MTAAETTASVAAVRPGWPVRAVRGLGHFARRSPARACFPTR